MTGTKKNEKFVKNGVVPLLDRIAHSCLQVDNITGQNQKYIYIKGRP